MDTRPDSFPVELPPSDPSRRPNDGARGAHPRASERAPRRAHAWLGWAVLFVALVPLLAACEISLSGTVRPVDFAVTSASYETDTRMVVDGIEDSVICDDRTTTVTYTFAYTGELLAWRSYFKGVTYGEIVGDVWFVPSDPGVEHLGPRKLRVTYAIPPGMAPLAVAPTSDARDLAPDGTASTASGSDSAPEPQIVVEPVVLGWSKLHLEVEGAGVYTFGTSRVSDAIPVVQSCG